MFHLFLETNDHCDDELLSPPQLRDREPHPSFERDLWSLSGSFPDPTVLSGVRPGPSVIPVLRTYL